MTAAAERANLATALGTAVPAAKVYDMPPVSLAGLSLIVEPDGWALRNAAQVEYRVQVHVIHNAPDTTSALATLESTAATAWLASLAAGWAVQDMGGPQAVTYADQPYLSMTYQARKIVTLAS